MNSVQITLNYNDGSPYTFTLLEYNILSPQNNKMSFGQLLKMGVDKDVIITGKANISTELYQKLYGYFSATWNNSTIGTVQVTYSMPSGSDGNPVNQTLNFDKAVVSSIDIIKEYSMLDDTHGIIYAYIGLSLADNKDLNQYYQTTGF